MSGENSVEYYLKREQQERDLAASAMDVSIRAIHLDMADRYAELAQVDKHSQTFQSSTFQ